MQHSFRNLFRNKVNMINIENLWSNLREKQYLNAMMELKQELEILSSMDNLETSLKLRIHRSLKNVVFLVEKLKNKS